VAECEGCTLLRTDGRTATRRSAQASGAGIVLVDACLDAHRATRLAIAVADQAGAPARDAAAGLLQAAGYAVSPIDDVPGKVVLRTVAMLANEAADAVHQGVGDAGGVDLAMRMGVHYPKGPLAWADALGLARVVETLDHLAAHYGEDRYRVSPLLRRKQLAGGRFFDAA
jgi:3-hydroxybutyryl-CoA dehydrogenase